MAEVKTLYIDVKDSELDGLEKKLKRVDVQMDNVEGGTKRVSRGLEEVRNNGGAIATLDTVTGGAATKMRDLAEATKLFSFNLSAVKTALLATGIGALVVALGAIVAYWDEIVEFITAANDKLREQARLSKERQERLSFELEILKKQEELQKIQGKSTKEVVELQKEKIALLIQEAQAELAVLGALREKLRIRTEESKLVRNTVGKLLAFAATASGIGRVEQAAGSLYSTLFNTDNLKEVNKQIEDLQLKLAGFRIDQANINKVDPTRGADQSKAETTVSPLTGLPIEAVAEFIDIESELLRSADQARTKSADAEAKAREMISDREFELKQKNLFAYADAASAVGALIGQETAAGKALSAAGALINTYASIAGQLKAFAGVPIPGYAIAQAIATAAVGFKAVKDILSVNVPGGGTASSPASPVAPSFNIVAGSGQNQLNQALIERDQQPVQAFITEGEIGSKEELRRKKLATSSF